MTKDFKLIDKDQWLLYKIVLVELRTVGKQQIVSKLSKSGNELDRLIQVLLLGTVEHSTKEQNFL